MLVAQRVAEAFGGIAQKETEDFIFISLPSGTPYSKGFNLRFVENKQKNYWRVSPRWPSTKHPKRFGMVSFPGVKLAITVSANRGWETLIKEIRRRFLPDYENLWNHMADLVKKEDENTQRLLDTLSEFNQLIGYKAEVSDFEFSSRTLHPYKLNIHQMIVGEEGKSMAIHTYYLPLDLARKVVQLMKEYKQE